MLRKLLQRRSLCVSLCLIIVMVYMFVRSRTKIVAENIKDLRQVTVAVTKDEKLQSRIPDANTTRSSKLEIVMGIPSIKRPNGVVYLDQTLEFVIRKRQKFDNVVFLVYLAELDQGWRKEMTDLVKSKFPAEVERGLVQIIHPPDDLYPDWDKEMKITLGDPRHQVQWRSKQNLDQAYLMEYAYSLKPKYYLGIEDDISVVDNYLEILFQHAETSWKDDMLFISYCKWGAIGKLFSSKMLPTVSKYLKTFWNYKPLDWLYWDLKQVLACRYPLANCEKEANSIILNYPSDLFDHKGKVSSLDKTKT